MDQDRRRGDAPATHAQPLVYAATSRCCIAARDKRVSFVSFVSLAGSARVRERSIGHWDGAERRVVAKHTRKLRPLMREAGGASTALDVTAAQFLYPRARLTGGRHGLTIRVPA